MIFPNIVVDTLVQNCDKFRVDATKSFTTQGEVLTAINIYPDFSNNPGTVFNVYDEDDCENWFLDWAYETEGEYTVRVEMTTATLTKTKDITVTSVTEAEDFLFADDSDVYAEENELRNYIPNGRNSWKYKHRAAQSDMLDWMYHNNITNKDDSRILKTQLIGDDLNKWAKYEAIMKIYEEIKITNSELFNEKITEYTQKRNDAREIYRLVYDSNKDGTIDEKDEPTQTRPKFFSR